MATRIHKASPSATGIKKNMNQITGKNIRSASNFNGVDTRQKFETIDKFLGYRSREDYTLLPAGYTIPGSQNVLIDWSGRLKTRKGYTLDGQAGTSGKKIITAYDWIEHKNGVLNFRQTSDGLLQFRYDNGTSIVWQTVQSGLSTTNPIRFTNYWDNTEKINEILYVNGNNNVYQWNGFYSTVASVTANTGIIQTMNVSLGGSGYAINDTITITGGSGTATAQVTQLAIGAISAVSLVHAGTGYTAGDILNIQYSSSTQIFGYGATIKVLTVSSGAIATYQLLTGGSGYGSLLAANGPGYPHPEISGGTGTGCGFNLTTVDTSIASVKILNNGSGYSIANYIATTGGTGTGTTVDITVVATNSITINDTRTLGDMGVYVSSQNVIVINGVEYTYTGGQGSSTFTGITPSPVGAMAAGDFIYQKVITTAGVNITNVESAYIFDGIANLNNHICFGSSESDNIYVSKKDNYNSCAFTSPVRLVGEGALLNLRSYWNTFIVQEDTMYISAGDSQWYTFQATLSADLTSESLTITPLKNASKQGSFSQELVTKDKNNVVFVSNEPVFSTIGRVSGVINTPMQGDYSYPIIDDFNNYDFTGGYAKYFKNFIYIAIPKSGVVIILNQTDSNNIFWEAPQTMPFSCFSVIDGAIYGHGNNIDETYKMFEGYNDNGHPMPARAVFSFLNYGTKALSKYFNEFWVDGYISQNTKLTAVNNFDIGGFQTPLTQMIDGSNSQIVAAQKSNASLGKTMLGKKSLGLDSINSSPTLPPYFAVILTQPRKDFYFVQFVLESTGIDYHWEILSLGPLVNNTMYGSNSLKI